MVSGRNEVARGAGRWTFAFPIKLHGGADQVGPIKPGDQVMVHDAPTGVEFGQRLVVRRTATVVRGGPLDRLRARIEGYLELTELYEVSFSDGRAT